MFDPPKLPKWLSIHLHSSIR